MEWRKAEDEGTEPRQKQETGKPEQQRVQSKIDE